MFQDSLDITVKKNGFQAAKSLHWGSVTVYGLTGSSLQSITVNGGALQGKLGRHFVAVEKSKIEILYRNLTKMVTNLRFCPIIFGFLSFM